MCEFHESTCNGFGDIWWIDNPIYFSSIDITPCLGIKKIKIKYGGLSNFVIRARGFVLEGVCPTGVLS